LQRKFVAPASGFAHRWLLALVRGGAARLEVGGARFEVIPGTVALLTPSLVVRIIPHGTVTIGALDFDGEWLERIIFWDQQASPAPGRGAHWSLPQWHDSLFRIAALHEDVDLVAECLNELITLSSPNAAGDGLVRVQALTFTVLDAVAGPLALPGPSLPWTALHPTPRPFGPVREPVRRAVDLLHQCPKRAWTARDLAREVGLSTSALGRAFVSTFASPPMRYLRFVRVQTFAHLLAATADPVGVCAAQAGWSDPSHAARVFKNVTGHTPTGYRRSSPHVEIFKVQ
jgi:AraC-like DNA-binding protein